MSVYYTGLNASPMLFNDENMEVVVNKITLVPFTGLNDMEIGWNYFLLWKNEELYVTGILHAIDKEKDNHPRLLTVPDNSTCKAAIPCKDGILILTTNNDVWQYKLYQNSWKKVSDFMYDKNDSEPEHPIKIVQGGCTVILTNLGRVYNVPILVNMPKRVKFVDVACGFDHTILLADNGDAYSMGIGTRGQLGHGDLEDCDNPTLIHALAGLKVVQVTAGGWHSAVLTSEGDVYSWGWNTNGQLGSMIEDTKVLAIPTLVNFEDENGKTVEVKVKKIQCGNAFTICMTEDGDFWGCGSNKYGQLGLPQTNISQHDKFVKLCTGLNSKDVKNIKCREWGTVILTN